jgi:hypothetical protein
MLFCLTALLLHSSVSGAGGDPDTSGCDREATRLGEQVIAVKAAIRDPNTADAMTTITELGTDSRYYTMVRGWLMLVIQGDQSIVDASKPGTRPDIEARISFLQQAIRGIDLE